MIRRREFLKYLSLVIPLGLWGCGDDGNTSSGTITPLEPGQCTTGGSVTYTNPGHAHTTVTLSLVAIQQETVGNYQLLTGGHDHTFSLSAQNLADLKEGKTITINGDLEGHGHNISIICV